MQPANDSPSDDTIARRWPRFDVDLSLRVRVPASLENEYVLAHGHNVSQGGMSLYVPVELQIGEIAELELSFPGIDAPVNLKARIKNRKDFKYGVEFIEPSIEQQNIILTNLHRLMR